jgi:pimeloyl-ACP methyl ester carboxylesterase
MRNVCQVLPISIAIIWKAEYFWLSTRSFAATVRRPAVYWRPMPAAGRDYAKDIAGSKLIIYPATGHIPQEEVADQSAADVKAFLLATAKP